MDRTERIILNGKVVSIDYGLTTIIKLCNKTGNITYTCCSGLIRYHDRLDHRRAAFILFKNLTPWLRKELIRIGFIIQADINGKRNLAAIPNVLDKHKIVKWQKLERFLLKRRHMI